VRRSCGQSRAEMSDPLEKSLMARRLCPWWLGYLLASPVRRLFQNPRVLLQPMVTEELVV
jgi:hypothetical protein